MILIIAIVITAALLTVGFVFKKKILVWARKKSVSMQIGSLKNAIKAADADKEATGRKNIVIFNSTQKQFETVQKKVLKFAASKNKGKKVLRGAKKRDDGSKIAMNGSGKRFMDYERVSKLENKSLYATR